MRQAHEVPVMTGRYPGRQETEAQGSAAPPPPTPDDDVGDDVKGLPR